MESGIHFRPDAAIALKKVAEYGKAGKNIFYDLEESAAGLSAWNQMETSGTGHTFIALLGIDDFSQLLGHPIFGSSGKALAL